MTQTERLSMPEYAAHVTTDVTEVTEDQIDGLVDALAPVYGAVSMLGGTLSAQLTVSGNELRDAAVQATATVNLALHHASIADIRTSHVTRVEVLTQAEFERRQDGGDSL